MLASDSLTPKEKKIAGLRIYGLTVEEIAKRCGNSPKTIGAHLYNIYGKLQVSNVRELKKVIEDEQALQNLQPPLSNK